MSVFKPDDSPYYYAAFLDEHGRRVRVSTKQILKRDALRVEAELRNRAERVRLGLEMRDRNPLRWTFADASAWWVRDIASEQAQGEKVKPVIKRHLIKSTLAHVPIDQLTAADFNEWLKAKAKEVSPASANKFRAYAMSIYSRAIELGRFMGENPVKLTKKLAVDAPRSRALPPTYLQALMSNPPTLGWLVAFTAAGYAGMRASEIHETFGNKPWSNVDLDARIITLQKTKTGAPRRVAIHPVLEDVLRFARRRGVEMPSVSAWTKAPQRVREALSRAGIDDERARFHGLRGMWFTQMLASGADINVAKFMGWGPAPGDSAEMHYLAYSDERLRGEIDKLTYPLKAEDEGDGR